jgi:hypothetical protein
MEFALKVLFVLGLYLQSELEFLLNISDGKQLQLLLQMYEKSRDELNMEGYSKDPYLMLD